MTYVEREGGTRRETTKLLGLEVIRFLSACSVLIWHYQHFYYIGDKAGSGYIVPDQPLYGLLAPFYNAGYFGVNVFWCISGFIFFWKYRNAIAERRVGRWRFFVLRFSRLYPLHFTTLLLVAGLQGIYHHVKGIYFVYPANDLYHFVLQLFFASSWGLQQNYSFNGPIWSISVEVLVYLLFFVTLRYLGKSIWVAVAAISIAGAVKLLKIESPIADCLGFFYVGGMTCLIRQRLAGTPLDRLARPAAWLLVVVAPLAAYMVGALAYPPTAYLFWLGYAPLLLYVTAGDLHLGRRARSMVEAAGNMTYSSYLIHFPLQLAVMIVSAYAGWAVPVGSATFLCLYLGTTLVLAYLLFELLEKPAQKAIRRRFLPVRFSNHGESRSAIP